MASPVVLITGANSGVGYAATQIFASSPRGYQIILACRSLSKATEAKSSIEASNPKGTLHTVHLDVTDDQSVKKAAQWVDSKFGRLDVLINNAGIGNMDPDVKVRWEATLATNVTGPAVVAEYFRPLLLKNFGSYSIYVSSGLGSSAMYDIPTGIPNDGPYRASKAALNMIAMQEWNEFKYKGLKTYAFCPGFVVSNLRGPSEMARTGGGKAGDPLEAGRALLDVAEGKRDFNAGRFIHGSGEYPW